jgi:hypothetical protein
VEGRNISSFEVSQAVLAHPSGKEKEENKTLWETKKAEGLKVDFYRLQTEGRKV